MAIVAIRAGSGKVVPLNPVNLLDGLLARGYRAGATVTHATGDNMLQAQALAKAADVAIVVLASSSTEGHDRVNISLGGDSLVGPIASVAKKTIVLTVSPGPFLTSWRDNVDAIVDFGFAGEQEGHGMADIIFGDVTPSGKLPHT